jgi:putative phosphoribosyl transferase
MRFRDRLDAGQRLADRLMHLRGENLAVLGLPRGGVTVAAEVARALGAPLDVILVRKLGVPVQPELGMGAIGEGGARVINPEVIRFAHVSDEQLAAVEERERCELRRRAQRYRGDRTPVPLAGRTAVVVDDGIATGSTARAACQVAKEMGACRVVLAVPVAPRSAGDTLAADADEVICLETPERFQAIGEWYDDFTQTSDEEVVSLLRAPPGAGTRADPGGDGRPRGWDGEVSIPAGAALLPGHLTVPRHGAGIVVFAHGSGSSRASPRNQQVALLLQQAGLGTLLFDLLSAGEARERASVFDIALLARRLGGATRWLRAQPAAAGARVGYFGASTGAAAALWAATEPGSDIAAVVSRGGRPDLAMAVLSRVRAPTLLIVGGLDDQVLGLNRWACDHLPCENQLAVVPGASHLFEEPGTLDQAAGLARDWFTRHLMPAHARA